MYFTCTVLLSQFIRQYSYKYFVNAVNTVQYMYAKDKILWSCSTEDRAFWLPTLDCIILAVILQPFNTKIFTHSD